MASYPVQAGYDVDDVYVSDAWTWKKGTRVRVREAWEFCLITRSGAVGMLEGKTKREHGLPLSPPPPPPPPHHEESPTGPRVYSTKNVRARAKPSEGDDDHDEFAALEELIRKSVLARGERYRRAGAGASAAARTEGLSDIIPPTASESPEGAFESQRSGKSEPLRVLPFPFPTSATSPSGSASASGVGTPGGLVPFPGEDRPARREKVEEAEKEEEEEEEESEEYDEEAGEEGEEGEEEEDPISPATRRTSESMSSLGQPLSPYPFVGIGNTASPASTRHSHSRPPSSINATRSSAGTGSGSRSARRSAGGASNFSSPGLTRSSPGQTHSTPSTNPVLSSPAQTHSSPSTNPASTPGHGPTVFPSTPSSSSSPAAHMRSPIPSSFIPPPPGRRRRRRRRAGTGPGLVSAEVLAATRGSSADLDLGVRTRTMSSPGGPGSEEPEPIAVYEEEEAATDGESDGEEAHSEDEKAEEEVRLTPEDAEREDSVGLLSASASAVSPRPSLLSLAGLRGRKSSGALSLGSRSRRESGGSAAPRSRTQSAAAAAPPRSRTQSLIQRVGGGGGGGTRSRSISQSGSASAFGSNESRRVSDGSRRVSSGVESSSASNSAEGAAAGAGAMHAPGVENTFGRPGELRRQVEEARLRLGLSAPPSSSSLAPPPPPSSSTGTSTPSFRTTYSELTARGADDELQTQASEADLSTAHDSFVTAPMSVESATSSATEGARGGGGRGMASAWTLRQGQDQWGHGVHGPI